MRYKKYNILPLVTFSDFFRGMDIKYGQGRGVEEPCQGDRLVWEVALHLQQSGTNIIRGHLQDIAPNWAMFLTRHCFQMDHNAVYMHAWKIILDCQLSTVMHIILSKLPAPGTLSFWPSLCP